MFGSRSPYNSDQEDVPVDNEGMRRVLNMAAQLTSRPDPSFETAGVPGIRKVEMKQAKSERVHVQQAPARTHSRSWSLPPPPPDSRTTTSPSRRAQTGRPANVTKAPAGASTTARQQQILAKARQVKQPATNQPKSAPTIVEVKKPEVALKERIWNVVKKWF
ncbi:hypothetical protein PILCRDRAFT_469123 [Piloderma croceum F 1598]|uniref:Uncharacterized protein n=1 Tax=Piloderma croceum (strain F 1598) TaxID=765440 RepID=A0A0C3FDX5_PILCF|nr:hypothetical protein PILCRDRAFT_469123 [Piloderma croceum F 1598]